MFPQALFAKYMPAFEHYSRVIGVVSFEADGTFEMLEGREEVLGVSRSVSADWLHLIVGVRELLRGSTQKQLGGWVTGFDLLYSHSFGKDFHSALNHRLSQTSFTETGASSANKN
jgi:hypothetical protein